MFIHRYSLISIGPLDLFFHLFTLFFFPHFLPFSNTLELWFSLPASPEISQVDLAHHIKTGWGINFFTGWIYHVLPTIFMQMPFCEQLKVTTTNQQVTVCDKIFGSSLKKDIDVIDLWLNTTLHIQQSWDLQNVFIIVLPWCH